MSKYCSNCGMEVSEGADFCPNCGQAVFQEEKAPDSKQQQQPPQAVPPEAAPTQQPPATLKSSQPSAFQPASPQTAPSLPAGPARNNDKIIRWALGGFAALVAALLILIAMLYYGLGVGPVGALIGLVLAVLPVPLYVALALRIDRYEKEPFWMLSAAFLWGASISFCVALLASNFSSTIVGSFFATVVSAPIVEESIKGLALFILFLWKKDEFDGVIDGILYAAMVGLGFAMIENYGYYGVGFVEGGIFSTLFSFVLRGVFGGLIHSLFTSMTGIGLGLARQSNSAYVKIIAPVAGLLAAMFLHFMWNLSASLLDPILIERLYSGGLLAVLLAVSLPRLLLLTVPAFLVVMAFVFFALRREGRIVRQYLAPELQSGLLTQQEYDALGGVGGRIRASFGALSKGGFGEWRAYSHFSQAATELAFHRDRVQRGITSVYDAHRDAAYVQQMRQLRSRPETSHTTR